MQRVPVISPGGHPLMPTIASRARRWLRQGKAKVYPNDLNVFAIQLIFNPSGHDTHDKGFSPVMVGQKVMLKWLEKLAPTTTQYGWQTSNLRQWLKLTKEKTDKSKAVAETHSNDGVALAASHFVKWKEWHDKNAHGGYWDGQVVATVAPFKVIARVGVYRRQLHFENPDSHKPNLNQYRKRKGGTITPFGFRSGDFVQAEKAGKTYRGWVGGYTQTAKSKKVSVYDHNWKRIGQFSPNKVKLLKRSCRLCVA